MRYIKYGDLEPTEYVSDLDDTKWAQYYCGHQWEGLAYLEKMNKVLDQYRALLFLPRGSGKTNRFISKNSRSILEVRQPQLTITGGPANQRRIYLATSGIMRSPRIREDYGDVIGRTNMNTSEMWFREELWDYEDAQYNPAFRVMARGGDVVGSHPKHIHLEDIIQEPFKNDESNDALYGWYSGIVNLCIDKDTRITGTGTRKEPGDFWEMLEKKQRFPTYYEQAISLVDGRYPTLQECVMDEEGRPNFDPSDFGTYKTLLCPNWPIENLLVAKATDPIKFLAEMQNQPVDPSGNYFTEDNWREVKWIHDSNSQYVISCDPAYGKTANADNLAINVLGRREPRRYVVVESFILTPAQREGENIESDLLEALWAVWSRWNTYNGVILVQSESNFHQVLWTNAVNKQAPFDIYPFKSTGDKIIRMQSLRSPFMSGRLCISEECLGKEELYTEYISFRPKPSTASRKDDQIDSLSMSYLAWGQLDQDFDFGVWTPASEREKERWD